ncbi:MAG TPA: efflux RND transporter permease subunit [Gemmatimonadaceae bacterium]|nr:efflux RND transporter permease subunit [Gemmatimonadaceae bacterium]
MFISDFAIKRPLVTIVSMLALVAFGLVAFFSLKTDEFPEVTPPYASVGLIYPGASPDGVEKEVLDPVEEQIAAISGVKQIQGKAYDGYGVVIIEFNYGVDMSDATQEIRDKISAIRSDLPQELKEPVIRKLNDTDQPIVSLALTSSNLSQADLTRLADPKITRELRTISGVAEVLIFGKVERELTVELHPDRLQAAGVSVGEVVQALQLQNLAAPVGRVTGTTDERSIRLKGRLEGPQDFAQMVVAQRGGQLIRLGQLATVRDGTEEPRTLALFNGKEAIGIDVKKSQGYSTTDVSNKIRAKVAELQKQLPQGTKIETVRDAGTRVDVAVGNVKMALIEGALLTILVVFLFLNSWRSTVITGVALPISVLASFIAVWVLGFRLETMSLLGLSLAIGILIDDAIVVRENIVRHVEMGKDHMRAAHEGTDEIGLAVAATTFSILAVFVPIGFMPGIGGQWFKPFALTIACAVLVSLFVSFSLDPMLSAYWPDPHRPEDQKWWITKKLDRFNAWFNRRAQDYKKVIAWALDHRAAMVVIALGTFFAAFTIPMKGLTALGGALVGIVVAVWLITRQPNMVLHILGMILLVLLALGGIAGAAGQLKGGAITFGVVLKTVVLLAIAGAAGWALWKAFRAMLDARPQDSTSELGGVLVGLVVAATLVYFVPPWRNVGGDFLPEDDWAEFTINVETPPGSNLEYTRGKMAEVDRIVHAQKETRYTYMTLGNSTTGGVDEGGMYVRLVDKDKRDKSVEEVGATLREQLSRVAGATTTVFTKGFGGGRKQQAIQLRGGDLATLTRAAEMVYNEVKATPGAVDVSISTKGQKPELTVELNRGVAGALGVTAGQVAQSLRPAFAGIDAGDWVDPAGETRDVEVRLAPEARRSTGNLEQLPLVIQNPGGPPSTVPLGQVATITRGTGPAIIDHLDRELVVSVEANTSGRASGDVVAEINQRLSKLQLPAGVRVSFGGDAKDQGEVFGQIYLALGTAVMLMYLILVLQFGSFVDPLAILVSLPLSLIGVMLALAITKQTLNIMSMIGIILLAGIVAKNAILLIDFAKWAREKAGLPLREALIEAGAIRLRPILMTTFALIAGMIPVALGRGMGAQFRAPMGIAVIGGVVTSTLLTLLVIPTFYEIMDGWRTRVARAFGRQPAQKTAEHRIPIGEIGSAETAD